MATKTGKFWLLMGLAASVPLLTASPAWADEPQSGGFDFGTLGQAGASLFIFAVLLFILGKWAWKPIISQLEQREKSIADTIAQARRDGNKPSNC